MQRIPCHHVFFIHEPRFSSWSFLCIGSPSDLRVHSAFARYGSGAAFLFVTFLLVFVSHIQGLDPPTRSS